MGSSGAPHLCDAEEERPALVRALLGRPVERPPFWLMRQAGRYLPEYRTIRATCDTFLELCYTPALAVEVTLQPIRRFAPDAAIIFSDILVVPHALGQVVAFRAGEGPVLEPIERARDIEKLGFSQWEERLAPVYEALQTVRRQLDPDIALIGFAGAPWTLASYMIEGGSSKDFHRVKLFAIEDPRGFDTLIALLVEATARHLIAQIDAGADAVQIFDSWAGVVPATLFERLVVLPTARIVARVRAVHGDAPIIGFPRGCAGSLRAYFVDTAVTAVSLDSTVSVDFAAKVLQPHCAVQGNLDPAFLLAGGTPLNDAVDEILVGLCHGPFVFNLGHGVLPATPPAHVEALAARIRRFRTPSVR